MSERPNRIVLDCLKLEKLKTKLSKEQLREEFGKKVVKMTTQGDDEPFATAFMINGEYALTASHTVNSSLPLRPTHLLDPRSGQKLPIEFYSHPSYCTSEVSSYKSSDIGIVKLKSGFLGYDDLFFDISNRDLTKFRKNRGSLCINGYPGDQTKLTCSKLRLPKQESSPNGEIVYGFMRDVDFMESENVLAFAEGTSGSPLVEYDRPNKLVSILSTGFPYLGKTIDALMFPEDPSRQQYRMKCSQYAKGISPSRIEDLLRDDSLWEIN